MPTLILLAILCGLVLTDVPAQGQPVPTGDSLSINPPTPQGSVVVVGTRQIPCITYREQLTCDWNAPPVPPTTTSTETPPCMIAGIPCAKFSFNALEPRYAEKLPGFPTPRSLDASRGDTYIFPPGFGPISTLRCPAVTPGAKE